MKTLMRKPSLAADSMVVKHLLAAQRLEQAHNKQGTVDGAVLSQCVVSSGTERLLANLPTLNCMPRSQ